MALLNQKNKGVNNRSYESDIDVEKVVEEARLELIHEYPEMEKQLDLTNRNQDT